MNRWLDIVAPGVAFLLYTNAPAVAHNFHGLPVIVAAAVPLLLCLPIARDLLLRHERILITPAFGLLLVLLSIQLLGALLAIRPEQSIFSLLEDASEALLIYLLVSNAIRTPEALKRVVAAMIAAGALLGALATHQQLTGNFESNYGGFSQASRNDEGFDSIGDGEEGEEGQPRLAGPVGEKNRYAQIMLMLVPLALFQGLSARSRLGAVAAWASLLFIMIGWALAFSRGAAVGLFLMFIVMMLLGLVRVKHVALAAFALAITIAVVPVYGARILSLVDLAGSVTSGGVQNADGATRGRMTELIASAMVFADHPIIGVGPGMNSLHYIEYARQAGGRVKAHARQSHSLYVGLAAEHGLLGLLAYLAMVTVTFRELRAARKRWEHDRPDLAAIADALTLSLVAYFTTSIFLHAAYIRYFWLLMGVATAASHIQTSSDRRDVLQWLVSRLARAS